MAGSLFERLTLGAAGADMDEDDSIRKNLTRVLARAAAPSSLCPITGFPTSTISLCRGASANRTVREP